MEVPRGRQPIGERAMTSAERVAKHRAAKTAEADELRYRVAVLEVAADPESDVVRRLRTEVTKLRKSLATEQESAESWRLLSQRWQSIAEAATRSVATEPAPDLVLPPRLGKLAELAKRGVDGEALAARRKFSEAAIRWAADLCDVPVSLLTPDNP